MGLEIRLGSPVALLAKEGMDDFVTAKLIDGKLKTNNIGYTDIDVLTALVKLKTKPKEYRRVII